MQREAVVSVVSAARMLAWRAHCYGPPAEVRLEEARVPPLSAPDQLLVRVRTSSINPLDVAMIGGYGARVLNALRSFDGVDVEFPLVVGRDFCGEVVLAGADCRVRPGQRVWGVVPPHWPGAHAQYLVARDRWVSEAPGALGDAAAGGALYAALSACAALRAAGLPPRSPAAPSPRVRPPRALLLGLGGVGHAALQLLVYSGAQVVVGCAGELCARALSLGAAEALDRHSTDYDRLLVESGPYDAIVECAGLGGAEAGARSWRFGCYVTLSAPLLRETDARGLLPGAVAAALQLARDTAGAARCAPHANALTRCRGRSGSGRVRRHRCAGGATRAVGVFSPTAEDIHLLRRLADAGKFAVEVERVFPWWAGSAAYERAGAGSARGKLLLDFTAHQPPPIQ